MKREIKFRGKRDDNNEWVIGSLVSIEWGYAIDPETIGQLTGVKDANGNDIYEGDILLTIYLDPVDEYAYCEEYEEVAFRSGCFGTIDEVTRCIIPFHDYPIDEYVVVGNIHDNKELLCKL